MIPTKDDIKALGLCSGGLDSILSALVLRDQGIAVSWVSFETPFFSADKARAAARITGVPLTVRDITPVYLEMLKNPRCGYGRRMNPCMDCHALMFRLAGEMMAEAGASFLFSGEVLGQRPMSQTRPSLRYVEKHSGHDGYILRPLSAKKLPETIPEREGWVDRERLLDFSGRTRKPQMALADAYGITDYPAPAGGCLLTDKGFSTRLRDLFAHGADDETEAELHLLRHGRHIRLDDRTKIVVGRTKADNAAISALVRPETDVTLKVRDYPGPAVVIPRGGSDEGIRLAAAIAAGYTKAPADQPAEVRVTQPDGRRTIRVTPLPRAEIGKYLI